MVSMVRPWKAEGERPESYITAMGSRVSAREKTIESRPTFRADFQGGTVSISGKGGAGVHHFLCSKKGVLK